MKITPAIEEFLEKEVTLDGVTKKVKEWIEERELSIQTVITRRNKFYPWDEALKKKQHGDGFRTARDRHYASLGKTRKEKS